MSWWEPEWRSVMTSFALDPSLAARQTLRITLKRTYNGEIALVGLAGTVTLADSDELCQFVRMLFANDYVVVVIDKAGVQVENGGDLALVAAKKCGARVISL